MRWFLLSMNFMEMNICDEHINSLLFINDLNSCLILYYSSRNGNKYYIIKHGNIFFLSSEIQFKEANSNLAN